MDDLPMTPAGLLEAEQRAIQHPVIRGSLISEDGAAAGVLVSLFALKPDNEAHASLHAQMTEILANPAYTRLAARPVGGPIYDAILEQTISEDAKRFGVLSLLVNLIILLVLFRKFGSAVVPLTVVALAAIWTLGLMGHTGQPLSLVSVILPALLIAVGVGDSVHILSEYADRRAETEDRRQALADTLGEVGTPVLLTSLTTATGLAALALAPIPAVRSLGIFAAIGVGFAFLLSMVVVPAILVLTDEQPRGSERAGAGVDAAVRWVWNLVRSHSGWVLVGATVVAAISAAGVAQLSVETQFLHAFRPSHPFRVDTHAVEASIGPAAAAQVIVDSGTPGGVFEPAFLHSTAQLQRWAEGQKGIKTSSSLVDPLHDLTMALDPDARADEGTQRAMPATRQGVAQTLLVYEMSDPEAMVGWVDDERQRARITLGTTVLGTSDALAFEAELLAALHKTYGDSATFELTGIGHVFTKLSTYLTNAQLQTFGVAFLVITVMMILVTRSIRLGLIAMVPNLLPVGITLGFMGWMGVPLDWITLLIAAVAIGIAVDDTVHLTVRVRRLFLQTGNYDQALESALATVGRPVVYTSLSLSAGFLVFLAATMNNTAQFGWLTAMCVLLAMVADLLVTPALIRLTHPLGPERPAHSDGSTPQTAEAPASDTAFVSTSQPI
jgi:hypothetical protein